MADQVKAARARQLNVEDGQVIVLVARKLSERMVAVAADAHAPTFQLQHLFHREENQIVILDI